MISEAFRKTRKFETQYGPHIPDGERPEFHATPTIGWMNDPNGFSVYKGEYHLFYQHHPHSNEWGPMHWGRLKTKDFLHWERLPAALAPDQDYDASGCFSGGAVDLPDGRRLLMYTGVQRSRNAGGGAVLPYRSVEDLKGEFVRTTSTAGCGSAWISSPWTAGRCSSPAPRR